VTTRIPRTLLHRLERLPLASKVLVLNALVGVVLMVFALGLMVWVEYRAAENEFRVTAAPRRG
jgi:hypothetical protein